MKNEIIKKKPKLKGIKEVYENVSYNVCSKRVLLSGSI